MMTSADDVAVTSANDVTRADVSKRNLVRGSAWGRVEDPSGAWKCVERVRSCAEFSGGA